MSKHAISAVIMVGEAGQTAQEQLVLQAQRASTLDLADTLQRAEISPIVIAAPDLSWLPHDLQVIRDEDKPDAPFVFGQRLVELLKRYELEHVMYFGGGSAPLLDDNTLNMMGMLLYQAAFGGSGSSIPSHIALTNNRHSSDWIALTHASEAFPIIAQVDRDNSLAWLLGESGEHEVRVIAGMRPASSLDIDTPTDLAIVANHPNLQPHLARVLSQTRIDAIPVDQIAKLAATPEKNITLIGRVSPLAWQALNKATSCWIRVFAEERGMVASGRLARGEVKSLLSALVNRAGPEHFFETLATMSDAAIIDSRPLMAAAGRWPSPADRFASDLFLIDAIQDEWLREFTRAAAASPMPVILGGHSVVAGGLYALVEIIELMR